MVLIISLAMTAKIRYLAMVVTTLSMLEMAMILFTAVKVPTAS